MIGASILKELWLLVRDRGRLLSLFAMPVVFIVVFGMMFRFGPDRGTARMIATWHAPADTRGEAIDKAIAASEGFAPKPYPTPEAVRAAVVAEDVPAGIIVPPDFAPGQTPIVETVIDLGSPIQVRGPIQGALTGVVMRALAPVDVSKLPPMIEAKQPPGITRPLDNVSAFQITVPGNAVLFGFFISMVVAMSFAHERHTGTWKRLLAAPIPRWQALLGKMLPYFLISVIQLGFLFGVGALGFGMKIAGSVAALAVLTAALALCATSFGLMVASFGGTERQIGSTVPIAVLVMGLLGGCMFPRLLMPPVMQQIGHAVPHSWALDGYYAVLVRQGTTIADIAPNVAALLAFAAGFALFGLWRFRFER